MKKFYTSNVYRLLVCGKMTEQKVDEKITEQKIVTPLGFVENIIQVDSKVPKETLQLMRTYIRVVSLTSTFRTTVNAPIGEKVTIPLPPGKYRMSAFLGQLPSDTVNLNVEDGQIAKVTFFFGKEP